MQVILRSDIDGLGKRGDIVDVADGHARNFLLPKGKAISRAILIAFAMSPCCWRLLPETRMLRILARSLMKRLSRSTSL